MNAETLTEKLNARSDAKLRNRLEKLFHEVRCEFTDGYSKKISVNGAYIEGTNNAGNKHIVDAHCAWKELMELSFNMQRDKCRDAEVAEFIGKVESMRESIDEIQSQL